ncbi:hypothetical protein [Asaia krungthepensis]|uniref:Uncharacterized protein n=1 Tax=Asaia krungthepensis NRIC 0535 TaxID=1307925 RepID=A0ABQ0Q2I7_9PROT|nr:hypothetical protein [Asaia krungthepensis]GBQ88282.1 hypothetical protein AA0535_1502 [Asaia krungthepensis NRIC 0535]
MNAALRRWAVRLLVDGKSDERLAVCAFTLECSRYERCDAARIMITIQDKSAFHAMLEVRSRFEKPDIVLQVCDACGDQQWITVFNGVLDAVTGGNDAALYGLECRDYLAFLLDTRVTCSWSNRTPLDIVRESVELAGLNFRHDDSDVWGQEYCGQFWQIEHRRLAATTQCRFQTAFDLVFSVARDHGLDCYADGKTICLHQQRDSSRTTVHIPQAVTARAFRHDLGLATDVVVGVRSWDSRQRAGSIIYYDGQNFSTAPPGAGAALHTFRVTGHRMDEIRRLAIGKYRRIVSHAFEARLVMPALAGLMPRHFMSLDEGIIDKDRTLSVDAVTHRFDIAEGYRQEVVLRDRLF